jgi:DNA-binding GntR family transcriptional regulator
VTTDADTAPFPPDQFEYLVVADRLAERIRRGEFGESGKLPGGRELMAHYGVGAAVVSHARRELKQRGLVYSDGWRGTFTA